MRDAVVVCVLFYEEVGDVLADEAEEGGDVEAGKGAFADDLGVEDFALARGAAADFDDGARDTESEEGDEADDADGPAVADARLQLVEGYGVDDAAEGGARGRETHGQGALGAKVGGQDGDGG